MHQVYNGKLYGFSSIKRTGNTSFEYYPTEEVKTKLTGNIGINYPRAEYSAWYIINMIPSEKLYMCGIAFVSNLTRSLINISLI